MSISQKPVFVFLAAGAVAAICASPDARLQFSEQAASAGLRATLRCGGPEKRWIPEANGSGVAWLDYNNDGFPDLLIVNGGTMSQLRQTIAGEIPPPSAGGVYLFRNLGNGHFEDVTEKAGLSNNYWGNGANAADYNNDGFTDVLITTIGLDLLYKNNGNGTFSLVSKLAGLSQSPAWHTGSAFGDFDGDGNLDLFITGYVDIRATSFAEPAPVCDYMGQRVFCGPLGLKGEHSVFYRSNGDGTFTDKTKASGISSAPAVHGFTVLTGDFDKDGKLDIFVANDSGPNLLFLNKGGGTFKESALEQGVAYNADGRVQSNMGVAAGDFANGGHLDLLTTTFSKDYFPLFRTDTAGVYQDIAAETGLQNATKPFLGWACGLADFDNSGARDFWTANGHVYPTDKEFHQPITIFRSANGKTSLQFSYPSAPDNSYRGGAASDFDNDGKIDLVVLPISGAPVLLRNQTPTSNAWVGLKLRGTRSNRDAIGAIVSIESCGHRQTDSVRSGGSYISLSDPRLHFGLGSCAKVDSVKIEWPLGKPQILRSLPLNKYSIIEEPK